MLEQVIIARLAWVAFVGGVVQHRPVEDGDEYGQCVEHKDSQLPGERSQELQAI